MVEEQQQEQDLLDKYSRQYYVYGKFIMERLLKLSVLVYGLRGVGVEIAKNLILSGVKGVTIQDDELTRIEDLGSNFYLSNSDVGKVSRGQACISKLAELNKDVKVSLNQAGGVISPEIIKKHTVVVITEEYDKKKLIAANQFCRENNIGFIYTGNLGLYGFAFIDFGEKHTIYDSNGEDNLNAFVDSIQRKEQPVVKTIADQLHGFGDGEYITFKQVKGMTEINKRTFKINTINAYSIQLMEELIHDEQNNTYNLVKADTSNFSDYISDGICEQVKVQKDIRFLSLEESLNNPIPPGMEGEGMIMSDWSKFGVSEQLHITLCAVLEFFQRHKQLPQLFNEQNAQEVEDLAKQVKTTLQVDNIDSNIVKNVSKYARANISPLASYFGGIVAQEVIKYTGKYSPIRQWLHFDCLELLPDEEKQKVDRTLRNSRYDDLIALIGNEYFDKLTYQKLFMIGAGALGCELLKIFSLMGVGTGVWGQVLVTDNDTIEKSNLSRQFLFRDSDIGKFKAERACLAAKNFNPSFKAQSKIGLVCPETESDFTDNFWDQLDVVVNAVDNVKARLFVDSKCVWHNKPLIESGTLGTKCNSQVIIPDQTQCYGDSEDPPEKQIPLCTLKNFPNQIEHCIQWGRDYFEGLFVQGPRETIKFLENPENYINESLSSINSITDLSQKEKKKSEVKQVFETIKNLALCYQGGKYENFIEFARNIFQIVHHNMIQDLLNAFPKDHVYEGKLFWTLPKRLPGVVQFDASDPLHILWIQSTANILSKIFNVKYQNQDYCKDKSFIQQATAQAKVKQYQSSKLSIKVNENDDKVEKEEGIDERIQQLATELKALQFSKQAAEKMQAISFEKDDPTNWHIEFVHTISNLRARNYTIEEVDQMKVKQIAGKIIPAIATTTAMVVGFCGLQILKLLQGKSFTIMRNSFINLALPIFNISEPLPKNKNMNFKGTPKLEPFKCVPEGFTVWDKIEIREKMNVKQLVDYIKQKYNVNLCNLNSVPKAGQCIFNVFETKKDVKIQQLESDVLTAIETVTKKKVHYYTKSIQLQGEAEDEDGEQLVKIPRIKYYLQ